MKILFLLCLAFPFCAFGQFDPDTCSRPYIFTNINTPTNVSVEVIEFGEFSQDCLAYIENIAADWIDDHNSSAIRVAPASGTYNCHGFAFHHSDGGNRYWINYDDLSSQANLSKYWSGTSPTYQSTTFNNANKVNYANDDHSAIKISVSTFESKWGIWPKYQHAPGDCPYNSTGLQYYYIPISGDDLICNSEGYSTLNISGATYDWSGSKVSISGSSSSVTATKTANGTGWIQSKIDSPYSGTEVTTEQQNFWLGNPADQPAPILVMFGPSNDELCVDQNTTLITGYSNVDLHKVTEFSWNFGSWAGYLQGYDTPTDPDKQKPILNVPSAAQGMQMLYVNAVNHCGNSPQRSANIDAIDCSLLLENSSTALENTHFENPGKILGIDVAVFPNPASTQIMMTRISLDVNAIQLLNNSDFANNQITLELADVNGKVMTRKNINTIPEKSIYQIGIRTDRLSTGLYVLRVYNNSGSLSVTRKVIVE